MTEAEYAKLILGTFDFDRALIGQLLKSARNSLGYTLKFVEAGSGVAASHIWNLELGKKEVSVERLFRLCCFYGFPMGLLLESGLRVKREPLQAAASNDADVFAKETKWRKVTPERRELLIELISGLATVFTYLLRSTRPGFFIEHFEFPTFEIKNRFRRVAYAIEPALPPRKRMVILARLQTDPVNILKEWTLLKSDDAIKFEELSSSGKLPFQRPWNPQPTGSLVDFENAIQFPVMPPEEFNYINSLRQNPAVKDNPQSS